MTPEEILRSVPTYLDKHGWTQGDYRDSEGRCCILGAIDAAASHRDFNFDFISRDDAIAALACIIGPAVIGPVIGPWVHATEIVSEWNDEKGRTLDEVKAVCIAAADKLATTTKKIEN